MGLIINYKGILHPNAKKAVVEQIEKAIAEDGVVVLDDHWEIIHTDDKVRVDISTSIKGCICECCGRVITDGKIFPRKGNPDAGLCFDCY